MERFELTSTDGVKIGAYVAKPTGQWATRPKACVIVIQEIFGVNDHIRWVMQSQYAAAGYLAIAPCFFDRIEKHVELGYTPETRDKGIALVGQLGMDAPMRDIRAVQQQLAFDSNGRALPCGVVGYCWGDSVAYLASTRLGLPAVSFYGGRTLPFLHERPQAPVMFHFGEKDAAIPLDTVEKVRAANFGAPVHVYPAGHGFNRAGHPDYHPDASALALQRALEFFDKHVRAERPEFQKGHKAMVDAATAKIKTVSVQDVKALHGRDDVLLVDIRDPRELERDGTIPGALSAPRGMLEFWVDPNSPYYKPAFDPKKQIFFFCAAAWRSALATATVQDMGYLPNVAHIEGGFGAWKEAGLPVEKKDKK